MNKLSKNEEIVRLKNTLMKKIKSENHERYINLPSDEIMKIIIDSSNNGKYVLWVLREYLKENIQRFEDMGRVKQALTLFKNNLSKFTEQQKQLNKLSFQELETLVKPYQDVLTQNAVKRMNKEKIWSEIDVIYSGPEGKIYSPKTKEASIFLGQGTKWCTAAINRNMFWEYSKDGPLYVFVLPEKDEQGREIKYQLHIESSQFMDDEDNECSLFSFNNETSLVCKLFDTFSVEKKIKYMILNYDIFSVFCNDEEFREIYENILIEKVKMSNFAVDMLDGHEISADFLGFLVSKNQIYFGHIPEKYRTKELCEIAVRESASALSAIPNNLEKEHFFRIAVEENGLVLKYIPEEFRTKEICDIAFKNNKHSYSFFPENLKTKKYSDIFLKFLSKENFDLSNVPNELKTEKLCKIAVKRDRKNLVHVPNVFLNADFYKTVFDYNSETISNFPKSEQTTDLWKIVLSRKPELINYVPFELITPELCEFVVKKDGLQIGNIPYKFYSEKLFETAVKNNPLAIQHVPREYFSNKVAAIALGISEKKARTIFLDEMKRLIIEKEIKKNGLKLENVTVPQRTKELCEIAVKQNINAVQFVPQKHLTHELVDVFIGTETNEVSEMFKFIPEKFLNYQQCEKIVKKEPENLVHVPSDLFSEKLCKISFENIINENNLNCSFDEALKSVFDDKTQFHKFFGFSKETSGVKSLYLDKNIPEMLLKTEYVKNPKI